MKSCSCFMSCLAGQGRIKKRGKRFLEPSFLTLAKQLKENNYLSHGFSKTTRQELMCIKCMEGKGSKLNKIKTKMISSPPLQCSAKVGKKREKERQQEQEQKQQAKLSHFSFLALGQHTSYTTKNLKPLQRKIKARRKEGLSNGEKRRKEGGSQASKSIFNNITISSLIMCILPF